LTTQTYCIAERTVGQKLNSIADSCQSSAEVNLRSSVLLNQTQPRSMIDTKIRVTVWWGSYSRVQW